MGCRQKSYFIGHKDEHEKRQQEINNLFIMRSHIPFKLGA